MRALVKYTNSKRTLVLSLVWSCLVPLTILCVVWLKFYSDSLILNQISQVQVVHWSALIICIFLLPLNVGLEAGKWKAILQKIEPYALWYCFKIVLRGKSLNVITPLGIGDAFSKYAGLDSDHREQTFAALALDSVSQLLPTLAFGLVATYYLISKGFSIPIHTLEWMILLMAIGLITGMLLIIFFNNKLKNYLLIFKSLTSKIIFQIGAISFARYIVFTLQFLFVFWALGSDLSMTILLLGIAWIFLIKTIMPGLSVLGDLVNREISAVLFFSFFTTDLEMVVVASFIIWMVNIVLPSIAGVFVMSDLRKSF